MGPTLPALKVLLSIPVYNTPDATNKFGRLVHGLLSACLLHVDEMRSDYAYIHSPILLTQHRTQRTTRPDIREEDQEQPASVSSHTDRHPTFRQSGPRCDRAVLLSHLPKAP